MASIYYDYLVGSNSTGDGSQGNPYQYPLSSHGAVGDTYYLKRGQTFYIPTTFGWTPKMSNGTSGKWTTVDVYGSSDVSYAIIDSVATTGPTLNISGNASANSNLILKNLYVKGSSHVSIPFYLHCFGADLQNVKVINCQTEGRPGGSTSAAFQISSDFPESYLARNIYVGNCIFKNAEAHGALTTSAVNVTFRNCIAHSNGNSTSANVAGHGFTSFKTRVNITSGWGGGPTIYTQSFSYIDITSVTIISGASVGTYPRLVRNIATPTTPGAGEYGYTGGVLYVNLNGVNPSGQTLNVTYGTLTNIRYEYCTAYNNKANPNYTYWEGHGFALDDYTGESTIIGCNSYNNDGAGISVNRGDNNLLIGNFLFRNGLSGIAVSRAQNTKIYHNTSYDNNRLGTLGTSFTNTNTFDMNIGGMSTTTTIKNNIIKVNRPYGILVDSLSTTGTTANKNNILSATSAASGITPTNTTTVSPATDSQNNPVPSLQTIGEAVGYSDHYGKPFTSTPSIGAVQYYSRTTVIQQIRGIVG